MPKKTNFRSSAGFTLLELLMVIAIIGALGVLSASFYARFLTQNAVANTTDQVVANLRKAQLYSMMGKQSGGDWGVKFTTSPRQITLFLVGNPVFDEDFTVNDNINITGLDATGVTFTHFTGLPSSTTSIVVTGQNNTDTITISAQGIVSKQ